MTDPACEDCIYHSTHWLGKPFSVDHLCHHPKLMNYFELDKRYVTVSCKAMREKPKIRVKTSGEYGRFARYNWCTYLRGCRPEGRYWKSKTIWS